MIENAVVTSGPDRPWGRLAGQLVGVWLAAAVFAVIGGWLVLLAFVAGAPLLLLVVLVPIAGIAYLVAMLTGSVSRWTTTGGRRWLWAVAVDLLGFVGALFVAAATFAAEPEVTLYWVDWALLVTVPFPLVAALFAARWPVRIAAAAVAVVVGVLAVVLPLRLPPDDAVARTAAAGISRNLLVTVTPPPGYLVRPPAQSNGAVEYTLERRVGLDAPITVIARSCSGCGDTADGAVRTGDQFTVEYDRTVGDVDVRVSASTVDDVGADLLRQVGRSARPATDADVMSWLPPAPGRSDRSTIRRFGHLWVALFHGCSANPDCRLTLNW